MVVTGEISVRRGNGDELMESDKVVMEKKRCQVQGVRLTFPADFL